MSRFKNIFTLILLILVCVPVCAQYGKGLKLYESYQFTEAIPYLRKGLNGARSSEARRILAHSLLLTGNYIEAEEQYRKLVAGTGSVESDYYYFGEALMNNGKYSEAAKQFEKSISDPRSKARVQALTAIGDFEKLPPRYSVNVVKNLQINGSQFSPVFYKEGLVFSADKAAYYNYVKKPHPANANNGTLNLFYVPFTGNDSSSVGEWERFSLSLNKGAFNGPVTFNKSKTLAVFSHVSNDTRGKNPAYPGLMMSRKINDKWTKPEPVLKGDGYSITHPTLSPDGKTLYFSSDMPGGWGGFDLYKSNLTGNSWGKPENLGPVINTALNEVFPTVAPDGTLYFSSMGHPGFGGLDIFASQYVSGVWQKPSNQGNPLNSSYDDFGIAFSEDMNTGFFTSNRDGYLAGDNIYRFAQLDRKINLAGAILLLEEMSKPGTRLDLELYDQNDKLAARTQSDETGRFNFTNLEPDMLYTMKLKDSASVLQSFSKVFIADQNGKVYKKTTTDNKGTFTFYNLPRRGITDEIEDDTRITVTGSLLAGESPARPLSEQTVFLTNDQGVVISSVKTDQYGNFKFEHLPPDGNFMVTLNPEDTKLQPNTRIVVTDSKGKTVRTFYTDAEGSFKFEVLSSENTSLRLLEEENTSLRIDLKGKLYTDEKSKQPLPNSTVQLVNERGEVLQTAKTDAQGNFHFTNLPSDINYMVTIKEDDVPVNIKQLFVANDKGAIIRKLLFDRGGFKFDMLPSDQKLMASLYVEDPWLKIRDIKESKIDSITVIENIYYEYGKYEILPVAAKVLDRVVTIMKENPDVFIELSSHTDSRSSTEFNLDLSKRRAKAAVDYIISKGVSSGRITGVGMGEGKLVNYCSDGVECTEEQHQQNRRTEFKVVRVK